VKDLAGKTAVVTGGASGVGKAMAAIFLGEGMQVVIADVEASALEKAVAELGASGGTISGVQCDVTDFDSVVALEKACVEKHGKVHVLCNNAGVGAHEDVSMWDLPLSDWRWTMDVNMWGVIYGIKAFVPGMLAHGEAGHVVNTSSGNGGLVLMPTTPIYSASKAAVSSITESLHLQLTMQGAAIKAHVLYPGPHVVASNIFDARRNRTEAYEREVAQVADPITLEGLKDIFESMGRKFETTQPAEVAEYALKGIQDDAFYILPWDDAGIARFKARMEGVISKTNPIPAF
jgi:NAD(P)-dependent dehydrogenase (short-subunit alcohol dehydrogenase family)